MLNITGAMDGCESHASGPCSEKKSRQARMMACLRGLGPSAVPRAGIGILLGRAVDPEGAQVARHDLLDLSVGEVEIAARGKAHSACQPVEAPRSDCDAEPPSEARRHVDAA